MKLRLVRMSMVRVWTGPRPYRRMRTAATRQTGDGSGPHGCRVVIRLPVVSVRDGRVPGAAGPKFADWASRGRSPPGRWDWARVEVAATPPIEEVDEVAGVDVHGRAAQVILQPLPPSSL